MCRMRETDTGSVHAQRFGSSMACPVCSLFRLRIRVTGQVLLQGSKTFLQGRLLQTIRNEMRRMSSRYRTTGPSEEGKGQGFPPELLHLRGLSKEDEHWGGTLHSGRQQIRLQARLHVREIDPRYSSRAWSSRIVQPVGRRRLTDGFRIGRRGRGR